MKHLLNKVDPVSRRSILKGIAAGCFSMNIIDSLNAAQEKRLLSLPVAAKPSLLFS